MPERPEWMDILRHRAPDAPAVREPTDEEVRAAWFAFYALPAELAHIEVYGPDHATMQYAFPERTLAALRRVILEDRVRQAEVRARGDAIKTARPEERR